MIQETSIRPTEGLNRLYNQNLNKQETSNDIRIALIVVGVIGVILATIGAATLNVINNDYAMTMILTGGAFVLFGVASIISYVRQHRTEKKKVEMQSQENVTEILPLVNEEKRYPTTELERIKAENDSLQNENRELTKRLETMQDDRTTIFQMREEIEEFKKETEELRASMEETNKTHDQWKNQIYALGDVSKEITRLKEELKLSNNRVKGLENASEKKDLLIVHLKNEHEKALQQLKLSQTEALNDKQLEIDSLNTLIDGERKQLAQSETELLEEKAKVKLMENEIERLKKENETNAAFIKKLEKLGS